MSPFELALGNETRKAMDLAIPMGWIYHPREIVEMVKGREKKYTRAKKLLEQTQKPY
jgi:hypothetical protein